MRIDEETRAAQLDNLLRYTLNLPGEFAVMIIQDLRQRDIGLDYIEDALERFRRLKEKGDKKI